MVIKVDIEIELINSNLPSKDMDFRNIMDFMEGLVHFMRDIIMGFIIILK